MPEGVALDPHPVHQPRDMFDHRRALQRAKYWRSRAISIWESPAATFQTRIFDIVTAI